MDDTLTLQTQIVIHMGCTSLYALTQVVPLNTFNDMKQYRAYRSSQSVAKASCLVLDAALAEV